MRSTQLKKPFFLSPSQKEEVSVIFKKYPKTGKKAAWREILWMLFSEKKDSDSLKDIFKSVSDLYNIPLNSLAEIAHNELGMTEVRTKADHVIQVCGSVSCLLRGGDEVKRTCEKWLGISCGEKTVDDCFLLKEKQCFNYCTKGPIIDIEGVLREEMTPSKVLFQLQDISGEERPVSNTKTTVRNPYDNWGDEK